jgi:hypothetical protein
MATLAELEASVEKLQKQVSKLLEKQGDLNRSASAYVEKIGEGDTLWQSTYGSVKSMYSKLLDFSTNLQDQYKSAEQLAKTFKQTSVNIGIGYQNQKILGSEFNKSVMLVERLGGNMDDVNTIYSKFADQSGRVRILDDEEVQRIFAIEQATGLMGDSAAALAERFDLMGVGSEQFAENVNQILKDSQKLGLNSSKVVKVLSDNFENMQRMSFRGGVKAMTEMSKLAVKMRIDVSDMLGMADKFYEPEAAIEAAAQLQLMGGDIAEAFGDPFETMYLARNKPEELANRLQSMTENMVAFNEETGEYELPAEARQQLSFAAEQLGLAKDSVIDMAFQSSKMKDIKLSVGGDFTEEQLDKISSIAKFKDGQWKVDVGDESVAVDGLDTDQLEKALISPSTEEDAIKATAEGVMTTNEKLQALYQATQTGIVIKTDFYSKVDNQMGKQIQSLTDGNSKLIETFSNLTSKITTDLDMDGVTKKIGDATSEITNATIQSLTTSINEKFDSIGGLEGLKAKVISTGKIITTDGSAEEVVDIPYSQSSTTNANKITTQNVILENEKKVNQEKTESLNKNINQSSKMDVSGTITVNIPDITVNGKPLEDNSVTKRKIEKMVSEAVIGGTEKVLNLKQSGMDANTGN